MKNMFGNGLKKPHQYNISVFFVNAKCPAKTAFGSLPHDPLSVRRELLRPQDLPCQGILIGPVFKIILHDSRITEHIRERRLKKACHHCSKPIELAWNLCPYCGTPAPGMRRENLNVEDALRGLTEEENSAPTNENT